MAASVRFYGANDIDSPRAGAHFARARPDGSSPTLGEGLRHVGGSQGNVGVIVLDIVGKALIISVFVAVMMLTVEYVNVWTRGAFTKILQGSRWRQYVLAALLGAAPGCLGPFVLVTLHVQRSITLGALVAGMVATSGDEAFVMLALFPGKALLLMAGLAVLGVLAGWVTDTLVGRVTHVDHQECCEFEEDHGEVCACFPEDGVLALWRRPRPERVVAAVFLVAFIVALVLGVIGPSDWDWERIAFLVVGLLGLTIVATSSDEFFREHLWTHVVKRHLPRLLAWIVGALAAIAVLEHFFEVGEFIAENRWLVLVLAAAVGLIPESGPHLIFVTLFAGGTLPLSVFVASSIVQDGHGMIPLLAHSRRDFFLVKGINLGFGLAVGAILMALGL